MGVPFVVNFLLALARPFVGVLFCGDEAAAAGVLFVGVDFRPLFENGLGRVIVQLRDNE